MNSTFARLSLLGVAAASAGLGSAHAADLKKGEELVKQGGCIACHGAGLDKPVSPTYPIIAGQPESYLFHALQQYQAKHQTPPYGRNNPIMAGMVARFDAKDLHDIAAYVSSLKTPLYEPDKARDPRP
jgi:cytochrome c553